MADQDRGPDTDQPKSTMQLVGDDGSFEPIRVRNVLSNPPVDANHIIPSGWVLLPERRTGAPSILKRIDHKDGPKHIPVSSRPILVTRWIDNLTTRFKMLEVAWCARGKWRTAVVPREAARDATKLMNELVRRGFPAQSETARHLSSYLAAYEDTNIWEIKRSSVSHQMGWMKDGGFLCGRKAIGCQVEFLGIDIGDEQMADAIETSGTYGGWTKSITPIANFPKVELALYASLAAPVLDILRAPNFCVDWAGRTSIGKTTTLRVAASVWGCPDEKSQQSYITSWDNTQVGLEMMASTRSHLPLLVDDTKRATKIRGQSVVPRVIYEISQGRGRGRGSRNGGSRQTLSWRTVLLSTGESRAIDESKDAGAVARVISLWGGPFGVESSDIAVLVAELNRGLCDNFGHAGPRFVQWLIDQKGEWGKWRERYVTACGRFADKLPADGPNARIAEYLAVLEGVTHLAHLALDLPFEYRPIVREMVLELAESAADSDRAGQALSDVYAWAVSRKNQFFGSGQYEPPGGWIGRWDKDTPLLQSSWVGFLRPGLNAYLAAQGYDAVAVLRTWRDRGWLKVDSKKSLTHPAKMDGQSARLVTVTMDAFTQCGAAPEGDVTM